MRPKYPGNIFGLRSCVPFTAFERPAEQDAIAPWEHIAGVSGEGVPHVVLRPEHRQLPADRGQCIVADQRLITRVYFPRIIVPIATTIAAIVDFLISAVLLVGLMLFYGVVPSAAVLWVPLFLLLMAVRCAKPPKVRLIA